MDDKQFRAALEALGMTQTGVNGVDSFLGVADTTIRRWAREDGPPDAVAMLLRIMIRHGWKPDGVRERYGNEPTRARRIRITGNDPAY